MPTNGLVIDTIERKIAILNVVYSVMASIAQELRQTVERLTITGCGLVILAVGWLMSRTPPLSLKTRLIATVGILLLVAISIAITQTLHSRYRGVAQAIRNINEAQLVHEPGIFVPDRAIFPASFRSTSSSSKQIVFLIRLVWFLEWT